MKAVFIDVLAEGPPIVEGLLRTLASSTTADFLELAQISGGASSHHKWYDNCSQETDPLAHYKETLATTAPQVSQTTQKATASQSLLETQLAVSQNDVPRHNFN